MAQLLEDVLGFAAAEMFRRTIGMAWVDDFEGIKDLDTRAAAERLTLNIAQAWLLKRGKIRSIDEAAALVKDAQSGLSD